MGNPIPSRDALIETIAEGLWAQARQKLLIPGHYLPHQRTDFRDEAAARQARFEAQIRADAYEQAAKVVSESAAMFRRLDQHSRAHDLEFEAARIRALSDQPDSTNEGLDFEPPCDVPPEGWWCSREKGHEGPCAARPIVPILVGQEWLDRKIAADPNAEVEALDAKDQSNARSE